MEGRKEGRNCASRSAHTEGLGTARHLDLRNSAQLFAKNRSPLEQIQRYTLGRQKGREGI